MEIPRVLHHPRRLNLRLEYGGHGPSVRRCWTSGPVLPVILISRLEDPYLADVSVKRRTTGGEKQRCCTRVGATRIASCEIYITDMTKSRWGKILQVVAMQKPFPEVDASNSFGRRGDVLPVLPDSFLGGSAPRLRTLWLRKHSISMDLETTFICQWPSFTLTPFRTFLILGTFHPTRWPLP